MAIIRRVEIAGSNAKISEVRPGRTFSFSQGRASTETVAPGRGRVLSSNDIALSWTGVDNSRLPDKALGAEINDLELINNTITLFRRREKRERFTWQEDPRNRRM